MQWRQNLAVLWGVVGLVGLFLQLWIVCMIAVVAFVILLPKVRSDRKVWDSWESADSMFGSKDQERERIMLHRLAEEKARKSAEGRPPWTR